MTEQTFTLPAVPPSVNNLFVTAGNRRVKSKTYAAWMQAARWQIAAQRLGRRAVLIELNPEYAAMASRRIANNSVNRSSV